VSRRRLLYSLLRKFGWFLNIGVVRGYWLCFAGQEVIFYVHKIMELEFIPSQLNPVLMMSHKFIVAGKFMTSCVNIRIV
jgi:hypothetical protein